MNHTNLTTSDNLMDLDLNPQPANSPSAPRFSSSLDKPESCNGEIGERIRFLESVTARSIRRRLRRHRCETGIGNMVQRGNYLKRDSSHLVAKALEMAYEFNNVAVLQKEQGGGFYDCNVCLETARSPVLTCCGHLFCWACFYRLECVDSTAYKECPVCEGEVSESSVTPLYGNGDFACELKSSLKIPPRPKARRVESVRQRRALDDVPVAEALRRIRIGIGSMED